MGRYGEGSGETCAVSEPRRSQSLHSSTAAARAVRGVASKAAPREGREEGGCVSGTEKESTKPSVGSARRG